MAATTSTASTQSSRSESIETTRRSESDTGHVTRVLVPESATVQRDRVPAPVVGTHRDERSQKEPSHSEEFIPHKAPEEEEAIGDADRHPHRLPPIPVRVLAPPRAAEAERR